MICHLWKGGFVISASALALSWACFFATCYLIEPGCNFIGSELQMIFTFTVISYQSGAVISVRKPRLNEKNSINESYHY